MADEEKLNLSDKVKETLGKGAVQKAVVTSGESRNDGSEIAIIQGLGHGDFLRDLWLMINGYEFDYLAGGWKQTSNPIMNPLGIRNYMTSIKIVLRADFSKFNEKEIPAIVYEYWSTNFAQFIAYMEDYNLAFKDLNIVHNGFFTAALIAFKNAEGAGHRNAVRGVLSENVLARLADADGKRKETFFSKLNPLKLFGK